MELQLLYNPQTRHQTGAAFLRGNTPELWFREMSNWQIRLQDLTCFVLPEDKGAITPGGLLVVFGDEVPTTGRITDPYGVIAGKLFIPIHATLTPALSPAETQTLLIWHRQIFHPGIGFVGFDETDEISLASFLSLGQPMQRAWDHAHPGMPAPAKLQQISVTMPADDDLASLLTDGDVARPLSAMPGKKTRRHLFTRILDVLVRLLLRFLLSIISIIASIFPRLLHVPILPATEGKNGSKSARSISGRNGKRQGLRDRLQNWVKEKLEDIEQRRESEINRLLKMFDKDGDEALKYAIPLGGNDAGRGTAPPSSTLTQRSTNFSLGTLFQTGPVDSWSTGDHHNLLLRNKYMIQAQKAEEKADYRKAAYIYAHLLGDLPEAAKVLERGHHYHEAAALYKDHLKQPQLAAQCFEKGGLLLEAIKIYKNLEAHEKTGDLYRELSQEEAAQQYYQLAATTALNQKNFQLAARILLDKSGQHEAACDALLKGWHNGGSKDRECLTQYFNIINTSDKEKLSAKISYVYQQETPSHKMNDLLEVLLAYKAGMDDTALDTTRGIAYEIITPLVAAGDKNKLSVLKKLHPEDKEIQADIYRYNALQDQPKLTSSEGHGFHLRSDIEWLGATTINDQFLFLGRTNEHIYLLRMTPQGAQKYYSWKYQAMLDKNGEEEKIYPYFSENTVSKHNRMTLYIWTSLRTITFGTILLPSEKPFGDKLLIDTTDYSAGNLIGVTTNAAGYPMVFITDRYEPKTMIRDYSPDLDTNIFGCIDRWNNAVAVPIETYPYPVLGDGPYYLCKGTAVYKMEGTGRTSILELQTDVRNLTLTTTSKGRLLMARTAKGCVIIADDEKGFKKVSVPFANNLIIVASRFISDRHLVLATDRSIIVFDVTVEVPKLISRINVPGAVSFLLTTGKTDEVAVVDEKGKVTIHKV